MNEDPSRTDEEARSNNQTGGFPFTRRGMLAAGAAGLGIAGVGAVGAQEGNDGGSDSAPFADENHDHSGDYLGEEAPVDRLDVSTISGSRREGDTVYYDSDNPGPYVDGQDALEDVPTGGTLQLGHGVWDVAEEGRISLDRSIMIRGVGWNKEPGTFGANIEYNGTRIVNTGSDSIDAPPLEFTKSERDNRATVRDLVVEHDGNSPAILIDNFIKSLIADCAVYCRNEAPVGIKYENSAFFARAVRNTVRNFTDTGIKVTGGGYAHEFYSNHVATGLPDATAIETQRNRTIIMGGEYAVTGDGGTAIKFHNPDGVNRNGGLVLEPGIELTDTAIDIAGEGGRFDEVQIYHTVMALRLSEVGVRFGNTSRSKLIHPVVHQSGELVEWSDDALHCGLITDVANLAGCTYTDHGGYNPYVQITGTAPNAMLEYVPTGVPTKVDYGVDENSPVFHDGKSWYTQASSTEPYSPGGGSNEPDTVHYEAANKTITPDGDLETDGLSAWNLTEDGDLINIAGDGSIGGDIWLSWDTDHLYFQAAIDDPVHLQSYEPGNMFRGDNIQIGIAPGSKGWEEFQQYTLALNDDGTQVYGQIKSSTETRNAGVRDFDAQIVRDDANNATHYEVAIPWTELDALGGFDPSSDEYLGVDWAVLDADGAQDNNIDRLVQWVANGDSAIVLGKQPDQLKVAHLTE